MIAAVNGEVYKLRIDMINVGYKFLLVVNELIRVCVRQLGPWDAMQGQIALSDRIDLFNARPKIVAKALIASRQQIDIIQHAVMPVVFNVREPRALRLDAHIDVFGDQAHESARVICA